MQRPHIDLTATPVDLAAQDLPSGEYLAQVVDVDRGPVLYATAAEAPADVFDWFRADAGDYFTFSTTCSTWARTLGTHTIAGDRPAYAILAVADFERDSE